MWMEGPRDVQHSGVARDRRGSDGETGVGRILCIGYDRVDLNVGLAAEMYEKIVRLKVTFHIERSHSTFRRADEAHCSVQVDRNRCTSSFTIRLEAQRLQRLIE